MKQKAKIKMNKDSLFHRVRNLFQPQGGALGHLWTRPGQGLLVKHFYGVLGKAERDFIDKVRKELKLCVVVVVFHLQMSSLFTDREEKSSALSGAVTEN